MGILDTSVSIGIYLRGNHYFMNGKIPQKSGPSHFYSGTLVFSGDASSQALGKGILELVAAKPDREISPQESETNINFFMKTINAKEWEKLYSDTQYVRCAMKNPEKFTFIPYERTNAGHSSIILGGTLKGEIQIPSDSSAEDIGASVKKAFSLCLDWDKEIIRHSHKNTKKSAADISPEVLKQVKRLGGTYKKNKKAKQKIINNFLVPEPIRQFLFDIEWPDREYENDDASDLWVWSLEMGYYDTSSRDESPFLMKYHDAAFFGSADGGNDALLILMDSDDPTDPLVFKLGHDDYDERDWENEDTFIKLSEFLKSLKISSG